MQNCKFYIGKLNLHLIIFDPSVWSFSMHPPMWPQDLGRNVRGGFWKYWFTIYFVPLSALAQSAKICWSWLPQYFLLKRWPNGEVNEIRTRYELLDNRYAQKCCSAYAFSQKARLNQIPNQHANISKSCNEARLSPLPVAFASGVLQASDHRRTSTSAPWSRRRLAISCCSLNGNNLRTVKEQNERRTQK